MKADVEKTFERLSSLMAERMRLYIEGSNNALCVVGLQHMLAPQKMLGSKNRMNPNNHRAILGEHLYNE